MQLSPTVDPVIPCRTPQRGLAIKVREGVPTAIGGHLVTVTRARGGQFLVRLINGPPVPFIDPVDHIED
jgi:hypothetical protein